MLLIAAQKQMVGYIQTMGEHYKHLPLLGTNKMVPKQGSVTEKRFNGMVIENCLG